MKPIVIYSDKILDNISFFFNVTGIAIFPFVILRERYKHDPQYQYARVMLLNHERIHFYQQIEMLVIPYYIAYVIEYIIKYIMIGDSYEAYKSVSFEREAFQNEQDLDYVEYREMYSWTRYI